MRTVTRHAIHTVVVVYITIVCVRNMYATVMPSANQYWCPVVQLLSAQQQFHQFQDLCTRNDTTTVETAVTSSVGLAPLSSRLHTVGMGAKLRSGLFDSYGLLPRAQVSVGGGQTEEETEADAPSQLTQCMAHKTRYEYVFRVSYDNHPQPAEVGGRWSELTVAPCVQVAHNLDRRIAEDCFWQRMLVLPHYFGNILAIPQNAEAEDVVWAIRFAALLVKVTAKMLYAEACSTCMSHAMR